MSKIWLTPTDIKQYFYCKAIPYIQHVLGARVEEREYMIEAKEKHLELEYLETRRKTI